MALSNCLIVVRYGNALNVLLHCWQHAIQITNVESFDNWQRGERVSKVATLKPAEVQLGETKSV